VTRRIVQTCCFALFALALAWPEQILPAELFFRLDAIANTLAAVTARTVFVSLLFSSALVVVTFFMGRVFCGWACPMGVITDVIDYIVDRTIRVPSLKRVKYHLLVVFICLALSGIAATWILDPIAWASRIGAITATKIDWPVAATLTTLLVFLQIALGRRAFCRILCPLGALLGWISIISPFTRRLTSSCVGCGMCSQTCRMAAIGDDPKAFDRAECIQCQDCISTCSESAIRFRYGQTAAPTPPNRLRRQYLATFGGGTMLGILLRNAKGQGPLFPVIRPPGAVPEDQLGDLCVRCGACIRVCPTQGLVPAGGELSPLLYQTPILDCREGACAYDCNACGTVCPTGAIRALPLKAKQAAKIGLAQIDKSRCLPHGSGSPCIMCYANCPLFAIELQFKRADAGQKAGIFLPQVAEYRCTGCGQCETNCPVAAKSAIVVGPRTDGSSNRSGV